MEIAEIVAQFLPLGVEVTESLIKVIQTARAAGRTHFSQADEDAYYAATGKALTDFDAAAGS